MSVVDTRVGSVLAGYRIERLLGRGGMSSVYLAEHLRLQRKVALKLMAPELADDERFRERFLRESQLAASLDHPNVVPVYDADEADGVLYIAMRYVEGDDLRGLLRRDSPLPPARALAIVGQAATGLDAAHRRGLVHRDVKPGNILIGEDDHAYVSDFGLTKQASSQSGLTATGQLVGTVDYVAPNEIQGQPVDGRTDVYALTCVLYEALVGSKPFENDTEVATIWAHLQDPPPAPSAARPELQTGIDDVIARGMAKRPDERYATCRELVGAARQESASRAARSHCRQAQPREGSTGACPPVSPPSSLDCRRCRGTCGARWWERHLEPAAQHRGRDRSEDEQARRGYPGRPQPDLDRRRRWLDLGRKRRGRDCHANRRALAEGRRDAGGSAARRGRSRSETVQFG